MSCELSASSESAADRLPWLLQLGPQLESLTLCTLQWTDFGKTFSALHALQTSRLRHLILYFQGCQDFDGPAPRVCLVLACLPSLLRSLHLRYLSEDTKPWASTSRSVDVPASLSALSICCAPGRPRADVGPLALRLHARLSWLQLQACDRDVALGCLDAGGAAGLQEANVQARSVALDAQLAAEVARRGRTFSKRNGELREGFIAGSEMQVVHMGRGPLFPDNVCSGYPETFAWAVPCRCGACCACLGPGMFPVGVEEKAYQ